MLGGRKSEISQCGVYYSIAASRHGDAQRRLEQRRLEHAVPSREEAAGHHRFAALQLHVHGRALQALARRQLRRRLAAGARTRCAEKVRPALRAELDATVDGRAIARLGS